MKKALDFNVAFRYPFNRARGMWNILWILLPIIGWFALGGYTIRIVKEFCKGKFKQLPAFKFSSDLNLGFFMFLKSIPFMVVYFAIIGIFAIINPWARGIVDTFLSLFVLPIMFIHFFNKETVGSLFEIEKLKFVFGNFWDYIVAVLKSILLGLVFLVMVLILVGLPAGVFTQDIFLADFYRRRVK